MTNILSPDDKFDFDKVHLGQPNAVHGGVFFSKIYLVIQMIIYLFNHLNAELRQVL